jgi:hypothetical protein
LLLSPNETPGPAAASGKGWRPGWRLHLLLLPADETGGPGAGGRLRHTWPLTGVHTDEAGKAGQEAVMNLMNRAPWLWYSWALLAAYGLMADRRWLLGAAAVAAVGAVQVILGRRKAAAQQQ